ncbi:MAG: hypothetical protein IPP51_14405 [Bacteroidetes bacterium]|nr:hypothetical protein [Bacteroidota bacterium]
MNNLRRSFPEKSEDEIKRITEVFYRHFCDVVFETIKVFTASPEEIMGRMKMVNSELLKEHFRNGRRVVAVTGHYANWNGRRLPFPNIPITKHQVFTSNCRTNISMLNYVLLVPDSARS